MGFLDKILEYYRLKLIEGIAGNTHALFETMNRTVGDAQSQIMQTPAEWNGELWNLISQLASTALLPIAGIFLTCIFCIEMMSIANDRNNLHNPTELSSSLIKHLIKLCISILVVLKTSVIIDACFELASNVMGKVGNQGGAVIDPDLGTAQLVETLKDSADIFEVLKVFAMIGLVRFVLWIIAILIQVIVIGRMIEIYVYCSLAPVPIATLAGKEVSDIGKNYIKGLLALAFQGFLMMLCMIIYAVLVDQISSSGDVLETLTTVQICSVVLCFTLFKTGQISKSIFSAH